MWWEPAYIAQEHRDNSNSLTPIFFRIKIETVTGHRANSDDSETKIAAQPVARVAK
jgi:nitroimidazol reductase NimA-like FMN-containing flavoprotein (pyridoxamine 5'-phosphate oxidase superfamily)